MSSRTRSFLAGVTLLALTGCATAPPPEPTAPMDQAAPASVPSPPPPPPASQPATIDSVFLVGDAGERGAKDEVLAALREEVQKASAALGSGHVTVIFLGDNIYDNGLPDENGTSAFKSALARLKAQVDSANVNSGVGVYFVPGNHDWDHQGKQGLARIKRQTRELRTFGANVEMLPGDGCPGPAVKTAGDRLQILFLDTQWWLHKFARPAAADCTPGTEKDVAAAIEKALAGAGERFSIVVAHHPLMVATPGK